MKMPLCQRHRRIKSNHRKQPRHVQNRLDHLLAHCSAQIIQLRRVVPRKACPVVAVIDIASLAARLVAPAKDHRRIRLLKVVVLDLDLDPPIMRQVRPVEAVRRIRRLRPRNEPLRMLHHPRRINAHVIRHHVARQPHPMPIRPVAQVDVRRFPAQVLRNSIVKQRHSVRVPAQNLDRLGCPAPLPHADQP